MQPAPLIAILTTLLSFTASLRADVIVLYHDNGPGHVRGLFNFDTATHATTFRTSLNTPDQMYAFSRSAQDGSVYAAGGNNNLYRINLDTGATVLIGATGLNGFTDLAIDPVTNTFYAMARSYLYTLNPATAAPTLIVNDPGVGYRLSANTGSSREAS